MPERLSEVLPGAAVRLDRVVHVTGELCGLAVRERRLGALEFTFDLLRVLPRDTGVEDFRVDPTNPQDDPVSRREET